jgi:hypothetical protein
MQAAVGALVEALHTRGWAYSHIHLLGAPVPCTVHASTMGRWGGDE